MNEILKLVAELADSNDSILALTRGTRKVTDDEIGTINNHACDVAHFLAKIKAIAEAKVDAGKCQKIETQT
jgi:hypothetical protein